MMAELSGAGRDWRKMYQKSEGIAYYAAAGGG